MKRNKGITLVALIVTIIILLILAGISIASLTNSGLFENARLAEQKSKEAQEKEETEIERYVNVIGNYMENSRDDKYETFKKRIIETLKRKNINVTSEDSEDELISAIEKIENKQLILISENVSSRYNQTINISSKYENYQDLKVENFIIVNKKMEWVNISDYEDISTMTKNFDPSNGVLSLGKQKSFTVANGTTYTFWNSYDVYIYI